MFSFSSVGGASLYLGSLLLVIQISVVCILSRPYNHCLSFSITFKDILTGNISFVLLFFMGAVLFLHFNVDFVTFVVRELAKSAMSVFVQRNSSNSYVFWSSCLLLMSQGW